MTAATLLMAGIAVAAVAALWVVLLVLAEEAPRLVRAIGGPPTGPDEAVPLFRAIQISRLALLLLAGSALSAALGWWERPPLDAAVRLGVGWALLYVLADALPRQIGALVPQLAAAAAPLARKSLVPFTPLLGLISAVERGLAVLLPARPAPETTLGPGERDMLAGVFSLHDATVAEVMTPRLDIVAVPAGSNWRELLEFLRRSEHARIPVYEEDLDSIIGILYAKDLTPAVSGVAAPPDKWEELLRPPLYVPESKSLAAQLRDFQHGPAHLAIVVDEFGGTSGLVTLEDVLEEVVGEIHGEYDLDEEPEVRQEGEDRFWVAGTVSLDTLSESLGTALDREDVSTVGGLIYSELGRVPQPGEELRVGGFRVVVERVVRRRIQRVYFERLRDVSAVEAAREEGA